MQIAFEKWHGCRNDFIVVWQSDDPLVFASLAKAAPTLCGRRGEGIGADGLIVLHVRNSRELVPFKVSIINSDGSRASTCGNGLRCAVMSTLERHRAAGVVEWPDTLVLDLGTHTVACRTMGKGPSLIAVDMGTPILGPAFEGAKELRAEILSILRSRDKENLAKDMHFCSMPNPHVVILVDQQISRAELLDLGPALQTVRSGDGINVHFAAPKAIPAKDQGRIANALGGTIEDLYSVLVWERGAGETAACGSGACAVGAALVATGSAAAASWIGIEMPGGLLFVRQEAPGEQMTLAGPAVMTFRGSFPL